MRDAGGKHRLAAEHRLSPCERSDGEPIACDPAMTLSPSCVILFDPDGTRLTEQEAATEVFLEMKRKLKGVMSKRRASMSLGAARLFLAGISFEDATAAWPVAPVASAEAQPASASAPLALSAAPEASSAPSPNRQRQIARELAAFLDRYDSLEPYLAIACERVAWVPCPAPEPDLAPTASALPGLGPANTPKPAPGPAPASLCGDGLRVTFDDHLAYCDLSPAAPTLPCSPPSHSSLQGSPPRADPQPWRPLLDARDSIMEVKCAGACPLWLAQALSRLRLFPQSFSKCGTAALVAHGPATPTIPAQKGLAHA